MKTLSAILPVSGLFIFTSAAGIFSDTFDSTPSPLWGNEVGNWSASSGVYAAQAPNNNPPTYSSLPFNLQDFSIDLDISNVQDGGVWLRSSDNQNGILLVTGAAPNGLYWHVISGGSVSAPLNVASGLFTDGVSDPHLHIEVLGNAYFVFVNGALTPATTLTDSTFSSGKIALYDFSPQTFDNVTVVPEPSSVLVASLLLLGGGAWRATRRHQVAAREGAVG